MKSFLFFFLISASLFSAEPDFEPIRFISEVSPRDLEISNEVNDWISRSEEDDFSLNNRLLAGTALEAADLILSQLSENPLKIPSSFEILAAYPTLDYDKWQWIAPYLLPDRHPIKKKMDKIFKNARASANLESFLMAGFSTRGIRNWSHTVVAKHPNLNGVVLKLFFDDQPGIDDLSKLMLRIKGAEKAREIIAENGWEDLFSVPRKWLYILPQEPISHEPFPKNFILVAEDMHLLSKKDNYEKWRGEFHPNFLNIVFMFLTLGGFVDSVYPFNLPFSKDGRIAVIDTEYFNAWPIPYHKFLRYLSQSMADHWNALIIQNSH